MGAIAVFLFIVAIFVLIVLWNKDRESAKFAGYLIGGLLLFWQIEISNRRATAAEKTAELTERGNIAERFKNAIEHLGHKSASIRLGGIYALHHIAQEVEKYRERVFEILCAYIRETTTQEAYKPRIVKFSRKEPTIEIQSILNLLFMKTPGCEIYKGLKTNLENVNLAGSRLIEANLQIADLQEANLQGAYLDGTDLQGANLYGTDFRDVNLAGAENLEVTQLLYAETLYRAMLPEGMEEVIRQQKPELLEKPSD